MDNIPDIQASEKPLMKTAFHYTAVGLMRLLNRSGTHHSARFTAAAISYGFLLMLLGVCRIAVLCGTPDAYYHLETIYRGGMAVEFLHGLKAPVADYLYASYQNSTIVMGLALVPLLLLFKYSYLAVAALALLTNSATLSVLFWFAYRFFGLAVAIIASLLFIFPTADIAAWLMSPIWHWDIAPLFALISFFIYGVLFFRAKPLRGQWQLIGIAGLGCINGFGLYTTYMHSVALLTLLTLWLIHNRRSFLSPSGLVFFLGFLGGFSPWILTKLSVPGDRLVLFYNLSLDLPTIKKILSAALSPRNSFHYLQFLIDHFFAFSINLPRSPRAAYLLNRAPFFFFSLTLLGSFIGCAIHGIQRWNARQTNREKTAAAANHPGLPALCVFLHILLFWIAFIGFCQTTNRFTSLYFIAVYPLCVLAQAIFFGNAWRLCARFGRGRTPARTALGAIVLGYLLLSIADFSTDLAPIRRDALENIARQRGYSLRMLDVLLYPCLKNPFIQDARFARVLISTGREPPLPETRYYFDLGVSAGLTYPQRLAEQVRVTHKYPPALRPLLAHWIGLGMGDRYGKNIPLCCAMIEKNIPVSLRHFVYEGLAFSVAAMTAIEPEYADTDLAALFTHIPDNYRHYFYAYTGFFANRFARKSGDLSNFEQASTRSLTAREIDRTQYLTGFISALNDRSIIAAIEHEKPHWYLRMPEVYRHAAFYPGAPDMDIWHNARWQKYAWQGAAESVLRSVYSGLANADLNTFQVPTKNLHAAIQQTATACLRDARHLTAARKEAFYVGIGRGVGLLTFGRLNDFGFSPAAIVRSHRHFFYEGFGEALRWRYGSDEQIIRELMLTQTPPQWHGAIRRGALLPAE
ncbi:MAG: hypothetical protein NC924_06975 [Candidatus Omnitrophica bacterium]|nr:hypothetical protein [Candidatus Omnitrophota bacterium]